LFDAAHAALPITAGASVRQAATAETAELLRAMRSMREESYRLFRPAPKILSDCATRG
jgi:hypothetical protein